ncbi:hypothetical protein O3P69_006137 [Scylla paramamosain]|uniref:Uncharacterized protein n=1 Tax=Scylla paramamosain TaxID=85552 RepID=A0AAW0U8G6_SCYPA
MKKLRRVIGSVANLTSGRSEEQPSASTPKPSALSASRRSVSGPLHETSPQRGSYYSYETQSLDSFNSGLSSGTSQVDPYSKVDKHFTKLHKWAYLGDINKLKKFIKKVPVDAQDSEGKTALHHAAAQGHGDALLFLLGSKSNVELKDNAGMTAFLRAVEKSQQHIVQMLLQRRVDMNVTDYQGNSSIHLVAKTGATDLLIMLLECGSDCDSPNTLGRTPLHVACTENQEEAVEALLRHGASVNVADKEGVTPLMVAAKLGSVPLVEVLIDNGANISPVDASKWTAADYARFTNHNQLHHRLKTLLDKEGGVSLIPQGLLSVSDEGSDQTEGAAGGVIKKPCDNEEEDAADNSWSDTSDVNSVKEKPKLNLTKFLPSSDESTENVVPAITEPPEGATGPPKPPRLYASSSSLASDKLVIGRSDDVQEKEDSVKDNDSWKSSSEDEKPKVKNLGLFVGNLDSSSELRKSKEDREKDPIMKSRVGRDDLMLELGLNDMKYEVSDEDISFEEEKPDLPLEGTPTKVVISPRNKTSAEHKQKCSGESEHTPPSSKPLASANYHSNSPENKSSMRSVSPPLSSVRSGNSKFSSPESLVKSPAKKSPRKIKPHHPKSSIFDSDSDEDESASSRPHRRKKQEVASLTKQVAVDEDSWDSPKSKSHGSKGSRKSSKDSNSLDSLPGHQKTDKVRPISGKSQKSSQEAQGSGVLLPPASGAGGSCTSTLSTVVGTLGREGTMQEVEEMWEANPRRRKPKSSSGSSSSPQNSESSHKLDDSTGKSKKEDTVRAVDGACYNIGSAKKEAHIEAEGDGHGDNDAGDSAKVDVDNGDTAQDVSDDDFGSSGVEDLLASKVKATSPTVQPINAVRALLLPKQNVSKEEQSSQEKQQQSFLSQNKSLASRKQKSLSPSPREEDKKQSTRDAQALGGKIPSVVFDGDKTSKSKKESTSPLPLSSLDVVVVKAPHKDSLRSGLGGVVLSDEESVALEHLASPHSLEEGEDRMSVTSTETEESAHINAGLKDSLLAPLSTLPDISNVGQLQDLVRELRLKLEKEFGRRKDLEARVSSLKQQEKQSRLLSSQQEQSSHQMQQEISSLMARVKQLEYQGRTEQDSSLLKDHTLQDAQQRCCELEEQCGALQMHAQQQEQMVNSLMVQLQTKERINLTLQDKLEELSSQTKYVSMKSCQTEDFLMAIAPRESAQAQTDWVCLSGGKDRQTQATPSVCESFSQTEAADSEMKLSHLGSSHELKVYCNVETRTQAIQTEPENMNRTECKDVSLRDRGTQCERVIMVHASCQNTPQRAFKSSQTQFMGKSAFSQTDEVGQDGFGVQKSTVSDSSCQTVIFNKQTGIQTEAVSLATPANTTNAVSETNSQVHVLTSSLENALQDISHDIKSVLRSSEDGHVSAVEEINKALTSQMGMLASTLNTTLQHTTESHNHEKLVEVQEGISQLQDTLQTQMEVVKELSNEPSQADLQNLHQTVEKINLDMKSTLDNLDSRITEALQNQASSHLEQKALIASLVEQKHENNKILTNLSGQLDKRNDDDTERFHDLKQHIAAQLSEIKKVIELSSVSDDSGVSGNLTRGVVEKLDSIEKSLIIPGGKGCVSEELSGVQYGMQQLSRDLHNNMKALEELIKAVSTDSRHNQSALMEQTKTITDSNDQLTTLVKLRLSEANSDLSEAIEENFRIVQDHLLHLQQTVVQRINEVAEHISISEDKKASNLTRQMMEIVSQVSGVHSGLAQLQASVEKARSSPTPGSLVDEAFVSSFKTYHQQASESFKYQTDSIIQQLEKLQKEIHSGVIQGQNAKDQSEVKLLREAVKEKESELSTRQAAWEQLQEKMNLQKISLASLQSKEEEWKVKMETLQDKMRDLTSSLKEKEQEVRQEAAKSAAQSEDTVKLRQENFRLSSEHAKMSAALQAEQHQRQWCEGELQELKKAKDMTEKRMQEVMSYVQQSSLQRTPPTGRDTDEDDTLASWKQELKKLEVEKKKLEERCAEQESRAHQLELQLREAEVGLELEKNSKVDLEKQLKKAKELVTKLQRDLSDVRQQQEAVRDIETQQTELELEIKSREAAMETLRKKLEAVNKEKLELKNTIMELKEEKLSFELVKQEKEFTEQMQRKTEEQLHDLQKRISRDYVSKASLQVMQKELENKYQLELSSKLAELNHIIQEQNKQQESLTKSKHSREQELKNELSRKSEEVIRLNAKLSVLDERGDTWRVRHDRLLALYQQQADLNHSLTTTRKHHDDQLSISLQEIDKHLKTPLATSSFIGQLTPPVSMQLPPPPANIDSYHYTHADVLDRTLQSYLNSSTTSRHSITDDKPQAKISPLQPSPQHSQHHSRVPDLEQSRDEYVDLLKMKYGI